MNGFDFLVLIIVGVSALLAFARGFVREFLSMVALVLAGLAVVWGLPIFREPVKNALNTENWIASTITVIGIFLLVYIAVRVLTGRIHEWVHDSEPLGLLDRTAGILFGVARGFVIVSIAVISVISVAKPDKWPKFLKEAQFFPFLVLTGDALKNLAPEATQAAINTAVSASKNGNDVAKWRAEAIDDNGETSNAVINENGQTYKIGNKVIDDSQVPDFVNHKDQSSREKKSDTKASNSESKSPKLQVERK